MIDLKKKDTVVQIRIESELLKKLDSICAKNCTIRSRVIRKMIVDYVEENSN